MAGAGEYEGKGRRRGKEGEGGGSVGEGPQVTVEAGPLRALLCHWLLTATVTWMLDG